MLPQRAEFENNLKIQKIPHKLVFKVNRPQKIKKMVIGPTLSQRAAIQNLRIV